ncbi:MAG: hypothetical protein JSU94_05445, partial [Phycisphaerales bacterium]
MKKSLSSPIVGFVLAACLALSSAMADQRVITVPDAGFDDHVLAEGGYIDIVDAGYAGPWECHSGDAWIDYGYWRADGWPEDLYARSGNNKAYPYEDYIYQILDETFVQGRMYTLSVWVGQPWVGYASGWRLYFTTEDYTNELIETSGTAGLSWEQISLTYIATAADAGRKIGIKIWSNEEVSFDDVTLVEGDLQVSARDPVPVDQAVNVGKYDNYGLLSWTAGATAAWHNVYFGTNPAPGPAEFRSHQPAANTFYMPDSYPATMRQPQTTYCWRIDEEEPNGATHTGDVWSFTTAPAQAFNPFPADNAENIFVEIELAWNSGFNAMTHDVYFGTDADAVENADKASLEYKASQTSQTFSPGTLDRGTIYYWRIDEVEAATVKGSVWSFSTLPFIAVEDPNMVVHYMFNEGQGARAVDWSGHENHGTLFNTPEWSEPSAIGDGMLTMDSDDYVAIENLSYLGTSYPELTVCAWIRVSGGGDQVIASFDRNEYWRLEINGNGAGTGQVGWDVMTNSGQMDTGSVTRVDDGQWHHVTGVFDNGAMTIYIDGIPEPSFSGGATMGSGNLRYGFVGVGSEAGSFNGSRGPTSWFYGDIDDFRIYDKALSQADIKQAMRGDPKKAWDPTPANASVTTIVNARTLTWRPGDEAVQHNVYLGTDRTAVENADTSTAGIYRGLQANTSYTPPEEIVWGSTYYWRIDEKNSDSSITTGLVWTFTVADHLVIDNMEDYNDYTPHRIFEWWLDGFGYGTPTTPPHYPGNGTGSIVGYAADPFAETNIVHGGGQAMPYFFNNNLGTLKYSESTRRLIYPRNWTEEGVKALSLWYRGYPASEGGFDYNMATGTFTVRGSGTDIWNVTAPRQTGYHDEFHFVYQTLTGPGTIVARVESVQNTNGWAKAGVMIRDTLDANSVHSMVVVTPSQGVSWQRRIDTGGASAHDTTGGIAAPQWVRLSRDADGLVTGEYSADGSTWTTLGTPLTIAMNTPMYIGLCLTSHNAAATCEAVFSNVSFPAGTPTGPWASRDIGIISNDPEKMYVAISNSNGTTGVVYHPDANAILTNSWTEWNIPLTEFSNQGVVLTDVNDIRLGFGTRGGVTPGGSGTAYFDDIRLYRGRCFPALIKPAGDFSNNCVVDFPDLEIMVDNWLISNWQVSPTDPGTTGLVASYSFEFNLVDSAGGHNGDPCGTTTGYAGGVSGQALSLDGTAYVNVGSVGIDSNDARTIAGWVKATAPAASIAGWTNCFGFTGPSGGSRHFDIERRGGQDFYCIHVYGWERNLAPLDLEWHHLAATYDGVTIKGYGDG